MQNFKLSIAGYQDHYLEQLQQRMSKFEHVVGSSQKLQEQWDDYKKQLRPLSKRDVTVYATDFAELCNLNGLNCAIAGPQEVLHLAVPNFLADRLGLEPLGHELGLEVFGQKLYLKAIQPRPSRMICTVNMVYSGRGLYSTALSIEWTDEHCSISLGTREVHYSRWTTLLYVEKGLWR